MKTSGGCIHTPGPLGVFKYNLSSGYAISPVGSSKVVATLQSSTFNNEANAYLFAAAPELLEALTALDAYLDFGEKIKDGEEYHFDNASGINEAFARARAAIAKAEGEVG